MMVVGQRTEMCREIELRVSYSVPVTIPSL